ncbi:MAG: polyphosphate kinase 1 [Lachnospiraceae bacterium]|nr:polyphosphate kinase 1 [Lachnospiraceae bacterium]
MKDEDQKVFTNREFSLIKFNERVLEEAERTDLPLGERLNFAAIYQSNMDEFFMVRVGKLVHKNKRTPQKEDALSGLTPKEQMKAICKTVRGIIPRRDTLFNELVAELDKEGFHLVEFKTLKAEEDRKKLRRYFEREIRPLVEPNIVEDKMTFPFLQNKAIYAVAVLQNKYGENRIGIVPCLTGAFPRLIQVKEGTYILAEEMILHFLPEVFRGYTVKAKSLIRVTRNADIDADAMYDPDYDYREYMSEVIRKRKKLKPVRLELSRVLDERIVDVLCSYLKLEPSQVFFYSEPLDLSFVYTIRDLLPQNTGLFYNKRVPQKSPQFDMRRSILDQIVEEDKLLSYPYNSMAPFLEMLHEAANDETVASIRMTLYRMAKQSKVIEYLIEAAENGKEVLVVVELKARFDEEANIYWSRRLEAAGCRVIYGLTGYKVHSKLCLITRRIGAITQYITQIGTGNYNEKTSRLYTDLSMMTANVSIGRDAQKVFQALVRQEFVEETEQLLVAPRILRKTIIELIEEQTRIAEYGGQGYIGLKMNSLADNKIMKKLVEASKAGVKVDMVIRGVCCLVPGVPGKTDNIRCVSIVGRFLEHARVFIFGVPGPEQKMYLGSADLMKRNTANRVEIATPVLNLSLRERIWNMFETQLNDNQQGREMLNDGTYVKVTHGDVKINSQELFFEQAYREAGEPLPESIIEETAPEEQAQPEEAAPVQEAELAEALQKLPEAEPSEALQEFPEAEPSEALQEFPEAEPSEALQALQKAEPFMDLTLPEAETVFDDSAPEA